MKIQKNIDLYINSREFLPPIDLVQYDTGIELLFNIVDFAIPTGTTATLYIQKKSGNFVYQEDGITVADDVVTVALDNQCITEYGHNEYQLTLKNGTDTISTFAGYLRVSKSLADANAVESTTVIRAFDLAVDEHVEEIRVEAEAIANDVIASIPSDYTALETQVNYLTNSVANGIRKNLVGALIRVDDISSISHSPALWAHGKNLFNGVLENGYYSETNELQLLSTTSDVYKSFKVFVKKGIYTLSASEQIYILRKRTNGTTQVTWISGTSHTFSVEKDGVIAFSIRNDDASTWDNSIELQLERGDTSTARVSFINPTDIKVKRLGKNLLKPIEHSGSGYTVQKNEDGSVTVTGSASTTDGIYLNLIDIDDSNPLILNENTRYKMQSIASNGKGVHVKTTDSEGNPYWTSVANWDKMYGTQYDRIVQIYVESTGHSVGDTSLCGTYHIQLEVGEEISEFEGYQEFTEYTPDLNGNISNMTSLYPTMTLSSDTPGVVLELDYVLDIKKYIDTKIIEVVTELLNQ